MAAVEPEAAYPIESIGRALRLLTLIAERGPVGAAAAAAHLGVARSTAHRMLTTLAAEGFARQDPETRGYVAGRRMLEAGLAAVRRLDVRAAARPALEVLRDELGETVHLVLLQDTQILFVDSVESRQAVRVGSRVGVQLPAHCTAAGKAILATLPEPELARYLDAAPAGVTARSITDPAAIRAELAQVARHGWAANFQESEDGLSAVGAAIDEPSAVGRSAITVSVPAARLPRRRAPELAPAVVRAARAIELALLSATAADR